MNPVTQSKSGLTWAQALAAEKQAPYFKALLNQINQERAQGMTIYPPASHHFEALNQTPLATIRAVILGQDPYHGPHQAHGLAFSVSNDIPIPPSLKNIFLALKHDLGISPPSQGNLTPWAQQGVLLLNTVLSVRAGQAHSHAKIGWTDFTDRIIQIISDTQPHVVFLLWGAQAQRKKEHINERHTCLTAPHPSPLSAHRGFLTCRHFSKTNQALIAHNQSPINWTLSSTLSA